jgi:boron transporter
MESGKYNLPQSSASGRPSSSSLRRVRKTWPNLGLGRGKSSNSGGQAASRHSSRAAEDGDKWWKIKYFRGMINDIKRRAPFYVSDWTDAWDYRVVPATVYMYFAK